MLFVFAVVAVNLSQEEQRQRAIIDHVSQLENKSPNVMDELSSSNLYGSKEKFELAEKVGLPKDASVDTIKATIQKNPQFKQYEKELYEVELWHKMTSTSYFDVPEFGNDYYRASLIHDIQESPRLKSQIPLKELYGKSIAELEALLPTETVTKRLTEKAKYLVHVQEVFGTIKYKILKEKLLDILTSQEKMEFLKIDSLDFFRIRVASNGKFLEDY